jgi:hypothetical protein
LEKGDNDGFTLNDTEGHGTIRLATGLGAAGLSVANHGPQNQYLRLDIGLTNGETIKPEDAFYGTDATLVFAGGNTLDLERLVGTQLNTALNPQQIEAGTYNYFPQPCSNDTTWSIAA